MMDRASSPSYREIMRIPAFVVFLSGRVVSHLGGNVFELASLWFIVGHAVSPLSTIGVLLVPALITTVLQLPLAALADRWPKSPYSFWWNSAGGSSFSGRWYGSVTAAPRCR